MNHLVATQESSLLLTLEEISQLVSHSHDPHETLTNIVRLIQERFHTDVCSVYLLEPGRTELVLAATVGLRAESVGRVRMHLDEGLTGLVAERLGPVMVEDAFTHPRFKYFPEAGEDPYHSFLGVPLVEGGVLQGVLVVQTAERRAFSSNETRMLVTVGSQLAPLVSEARLLEQILAAAHAPATPPPPATEAPAAWQAAPLSPGVGLGQLHVADGLDEWAAHEGARTADPTAETQRLTEALAAAQNEITRLSQQIAGLVGEDHAAILQAQLMILQDRTIEHDLTGAIAAGSTAEAALLQTLRGYVAAFQKLSSPFFQERVYDIKDVFRRILWQLRPAMSDAGPTTADRLVLVSHDASVMDLFLVDLERLAGVIIAKGGPQSHAAILARSLGVPMVGHAAECVGHLRAGSRALVNGATGMIYLNPSSETITAQQPARPPVLPVEVPPPLAAAAGLPQIEANINLLSEVAPALAQQAAGVGLYRSEFLFLARRTLPTEEEQVDFYRKLLQRVQGRSVSIRTFDLRPDKLAHYAHLTASAAHPFDWRLVLDSPPVQKLFKEQVRAILRAARAGSARILVPYLTRSEQLDFVVETLGQARDELQREGLEFTANVPLGVMIEVPAATALVDAWAERVDYFAIGTNDLIAFALGIDRDDPVGASRHDPLHPGVLRMIRDVITTGHAHARRVTVCGEMAADPEGVVALAALRVDSVSVPVNQLAGVRRALAGIPPASLAELGADLPRMRTATQARDLVQQLPRGTDEM